ncbi:MAG: imidazolonepropionase-like amidohydrolase [Planctomycetota bacterium]|jgi:imidazolonepropionase-like amidohydrolase
MSTLLATAALALLAPLGGGDDAAWEHPFEFKSHRVSDIDSSGGMLITGVTVHSAVQPAFVASVLVTEGHITAIGDDLSAPEGVLVIDGSGKHLAPGVIDTHSHMAIERGINEGTLSITADCDISDVINADDVALYRASAGGVTTIQCLHGSANAIGGRSEVLKLRWGSNADGMRFEGAPQGIKFALGENPKQSNWGGSGRFPGSRMGVEGVFDRGFRRAQEYKLGWDVYAAAQARGEDVAPPRRDVRLDVLVGIIAGSVNVHSHCYTAPEILMLLSAAERYGFQIRTLQHVLEGYKVAAEILRHGAGTSTFSDWWGYKIEAYYAIPQNAGFLDAVGVLSTINSDSDEMVRRLYAEAGKSVRYAETDPVAALRLVTLNAAKQLGVAEQTGSIELGKDADLVLLDGPPLSVYSKVLWTMVDGDVVFTRRDAFGLDGVELDLHEPNTFVGQVDIGPASGRRRLTAITGATLHPVSSEAIENGVLLIQDGKILALGANIDVPSDARVIDASGQHVWPGMIALASPVGIAEISAVSATQDAREVGGNQPDLRTTTAINADSAQIGVTRWTGITRAQVSPQGGGPMRGQSAVIRLSGTTWEEMLTLDRDMLHVSFPRVRNDSEKKEQPKAVEAMKEMLEDAREYGRLTLEAEAAGVSAPAFDARLEALVPFANGEQRVALYVSNAQSILFAIQFATEENLDAVLMGCKEGWKIADAIAASGLPVAVGPVNSLPGSFDPYDAQFANAAVLHRAGCRVSIYANEGENTRNLPFHAGIAAAYGLPRLEALRAVTLYPAEVLGLGDQLGSLTPGKLADIVITDGDLLEPTTQVKMMLIEGQPVDLSNHQSDLYDRFVIRNRRALRESRR